MSDTTIRFLAVGKVSARLVVATHVNKDVPGLDLQRLAAKVMKSGKVTRLAPPGDFRLVTDSRTELHVHVDAHDHAFLAVTPNTYPRRLVAAAGEDTPCLMNEFRDTFTAKLESRFQEAKMEDELFKPSLRILRTIATKYSDVQSLDKIRALQAKVDDVKLVMQDNLAKAVDRGQKIDEVDAKANDLVDSAALFKNKATRTRRFMQCRYYKMIALVLFILVAIGLVIYLIVSS